MTFCLHWYLDCHVNIYAQHICHSFLPLFRNVDDAGMTCSVVTLCTGPVCRMDGCRKENGAGVGWIRQYVILAMV